MNPSYKKEKDNDYLILEAPGRPDGSEYQIRMLLLNQMEKILPCKMRKMDGIPEFFYDITCRQPMTRAFERRQMKKEDIEALLNSLEKALDEAGRYLLDMRQFVLKPDYIFRDVENGGFSFCYLPFYNGNLEEDFRELAEYILKRLDHNQEEAVLWGYDIYSRSMEENFSIGKILESARERTGRENARLAAENPVETEAELLEVDEEEKEEKDEAPVSEKINIEKPKVESIPEKTEVSSKRKIWIFSGGVILLLALCICTVFIKALNMVQAGGIFILGIGALVYFLFIYQRKAVYREPSLEELIEEWDMEEEEHTVFLRKEMKEKHPVLVSLEPERQENIVLDKEIIKVGKQKDQVDIYLSHAMISRIHAVFTRESGEWFVTDQYSTNGTCLNGEPITPGEKKLLQEGMEVRLATLCFYFHGTESKD